MQSKRTMLLASVVAAAFMSDILETVTVKGQDGEPLLINKSDYDAAPGEWELYDAPGAPVVPEQAVAAPVVPEQAVAAPVVPASAPTPPVQYYVAKTGRKHFVVDASGAAIIGKDGIDAAGYPSEAEAFKAIFAVQSAA